MATQTSILAWKNSMDSGAWQAAVHRVAKSRTQLSNWTEQEPTPVFLSGEFYRQRSLVGYCPRGCSIENDGATNTFIFFSFFCSEIQRPLFLFLGLNWIQELGCCVSSCSHSLWERTQKWQRGSRKIYDRNFGFQGFSWFGLELFPVYTSPIRCLPSLLLNWNSVHLYVFTCPSSTCPQQLICK